MIKKSPIHYMGNKQKLMQELLQIFPEDISVFYDLFGGSGVVSLNVNADKYVLNDFSPHVYNLYKMFLQNDSRQIMNYCIEKRQFYGFTKDQKEKKEIAKLNKVPFEKCRNDVNKNPTTIGYYFLTFYSFCNQFRFSKDNKFNMPVGNGYFKNEYKFLIQNFCDFFKNKNVQIYNKSYEQFDIQFQKNCFVYMDIPYCNTNAVYNESRGGNVNGWKEEDDFKFFLFCQKLNERGIKWCVSNVFQNKGKINKHLIQWCEQKKWFVTHLNMKYASHGIDKNLTDEVAITNYNPNCYLF